MSSKATLQEQRIAKEKKWHRHNFPFLEAELLSNKRLVDDISKHKRSNP